MSHVARPAPDAERTARPLSLVRDDAPAHNAPAFRGANECADVVGGARPRCWYLPNGRRVVPEARGVYWHTAIHQGAYYAAFAVDSTGDDRGFVRLVPVTATAAEFDRAEAELWALLDSVDPLPAPAPR